MQGQPEPQGSTESSNAFKERAARSLLNHPLTCTVKTTGETFEAICANVSQSGMFLLCTAPPTTGADLSFRFVEQGIVIIQGEVRVARVVTTPQQIGAGVFFTALDGPARRLIDRVVALNSDSAREEPATGNMEHPSGVRLSLDLE